jgi:ubiquitin C-terminal hydrolase
VRDYISTTKIRFLFMHIEWTDAPHINDQTLSIYEDHPTHKKIMEELKAEKLASTTITLEQCLSTFQKPERLDEHNMWYCNKCKIHVPAMKTIELWRLPNIMILHLKRFEFRTGFRREKLDMLVDFPLEGLVVTCSQNDALHDPDAFVDSRAPATYDCFAVINHYGRMGFGHYTAFARQWDERGIQENWYLFDDSRTQAVSRSDVVTEAAYVLFYRRRE